MKEPSPIFKHLVKYSDKYHRKSGLIHHIGRIISDICTFIVFATIIGAICKPGASADSVFIFGVAVELGVIIVLAAISSMIYVLCITYLQIKQNMDYTRKWLKAHYNNKKKN